MNLWLKHMHIQDLMAGIYYRLLYFLWTAGIQKW